MSPVQVHVHTYKSRTLVEDLNPRSRFCHCALLPIHRKDVYSDSKKLDWPCRISQMRDATACLPSPPPVAREKGLYTKNESNSVLSSGIAHHCQNMAATARYFWVIVNRRRKLMPENQCRKSNIPSRCTKHICLVDGVNRQNH